MAVFRGLRRWESVLKHSCRNVSKFTEERIAEEGHALKTLYLWKRISLFVAVPGVAYISWRCFVSNVEHVEHKKYHPWPHLRIRNKPFPWHDSDKTLFHNPHTNPGPDDDEEDTAEGEEGVAETQPSRLNVLWQKYLFEDPEERDRLKYEHLAKMQQRVERFQEKKKMPENPIQPLRNDFQKTWKNQSLPVSSVESVQNLT